MKENLYNVSSAAIPVLVFICGWLGAIARKLIKAKIGETNYNRDLNFIKTIVYSVEQTMGSGNGAAKKKAVYDYASKKLNLPKDEINHLIERVVGEMNKQGYSTDLIAPLLDITADQAKDDAVPDQNASPNSTGNVPEMKADIGMQTQFTNEQINNIANAVAQAAVNAISSQNGATQSTTA